MAATNTRKNWQIQWRCTFANTGIFNQIERRCTAPESNSAGHGENFTSMIVYPLIVLDQSDQIRLPDSKSIASF